MLQGYFELPKFQPEDDNGDEYNLNDKVLIKTFFSDISLKPRKQKEEVIMNKKDKKGKEKGERLQKLQERKERFSALLEKKKTRIAQLVTKAEKLEARITKIENKITKLSGGSETEAGA